MSLEVAGIGPTQSLAWGGTGGDRSGLVTHERLESHLAEGKPDVTAVRRAVASVNSWLGNAPVRLSFEFHEGSGQMLVRVIDQESGEVIKEIPPRAVLDTVARIREFVGLLLDKRF